MLTSNYILFRKAFNLLPAVGRALCGFATCLPKAGFERLLIFLHAQSMPAFGK